MSRFTIFELKEEDLQEEDLNDTTTMAHFPDKIEHATVEELEPQQTEIAESIIQDVPVDEFKNSDSALAGMMAIGGVEEKIGRRVYKGSFSFSRGELRVF